MKVFDRSQQKVRTEPMYAFSQRNDATPTFLHVSFLRSVQTTLRRVSFVVSPGPSVSLLIYHITTVAPRFFLPRRHQTHPTQRHWGRSGRFPA